MWNHSGATRRRAPHARTRRSRLRARSALPEISGPDLLQLTHGGSDPLRDAVGAPKLAPVPDRGGFFRLRYSRANVPGPARCGRSGRLRVSFGRKQSRVHHRSRLRDEDDGGTIAAGAHARDRDESRRENVAGRSASAVAGEAADSIAAWPSFECGGGGGDRAIVGRKNRARRARTSEPRLQSAGAGDGRDPRHARATRAKRSGSALRVAERDQRSLPDRGNDWPNFSTDF